MVIFHGELLVVARWWFESRLISLWSRGSPEHWANQPTNRPTSQHTQVCVSYPWLVELRNLTRLPPYPDVPTGTWNSSEITQHQLKHQLKPSIKMARLKWQTPPVGLSRIASMFSCQVPFFVQLAWIQLFTLPLAQEKVLDGLTTGLSYTYQLESPSQAKTTSLWHLLSEIISI